MLNIFTNLKAYAISFTLGGLVFGSSIYFIARRPTKEITITEAKKIDVKAAVVETHIATNVQTNTKTIIKAKRKTIVKNPKFDKKGDLIGGSNAIILDDPTKEIDNNQIANNNTDSKSKKTESLEEDNKTTHIVENSKPSYSIGATSTIAKFNSGVTVQNPSLEETRVEVGMRVIGPVWATSSYDIGQKKIGIGFRMEF